MFCVRVNLSRWCYLILTLAAWRAPALAEEPPPIQMIIDVHMDPMFAIPQAVRPQVYAQWRDAAAWGLDVCEARGARITFLSVGEYVECTLEDPASWALIDRLRRSGGTIGTHSHREKNSVRTIGASCQVTRR